MPGAKPDQPDFFFEKDPALRERYERASYCVSVLGGDSAAKDADTIGYDLVSNGFSVATGGHDKGAMKGALEGGSRALQDLRKDNKDIDSVRPRVRGISWDFLEAPPVSGEFISREPTGDLYERLGKLLEESRAVVVLSGGLGTAVELLVETHFGQNISQKMKVEPRPFIIVGQSHQELLYVLGKQYSLSELSGNSGSIYMVDDAEAVAPLVETLFQKASLSEQDHTEKELKALDDKLEPNRLRSKREPE